MLFRSLLDPQGLWVGGDQDSASDGRNCRLAFAVPAGGGGAYRVRVLGTGEGAFVLRVNGPGAATNPAPRVVATTPGDGKVLAGPPPWLDLVFSEPLLANSLTATALQVDDGTLVLGCELLGGNVVRYSLAAPNRVGTHTYRLPAGAVRGLNGLESAPYAGSFTVDHTGPRIVSQTPAIQASAPFSQLTFTFDEEIDPLSFDNAVRSFIGPDGDLRGRISKIVVLGNQATVYFAAQIKRGLYTMLIVPSVQNTLGWWMDQNQNGIAREDGMDCGAHGRRAGRSAGAGVDDRGERLPDQAADHDGT